MQMWATLYNRVGVVKRHYDQRRFLSFPFVEDFAFVLAVAFVSRSCHQGSLTESCGGSLVPPTIYPVLHCQTMIRYSNFRLFGKARRPISPTMTYFVTRV